MTDGAPRQAPIHIQALRETARAALPDVVVEVEGYRASSLQREEFEPLRWAVPGLIPEGLMMLGGKPKVGKSWVALNIAVSVAAGGVALGSIGLDRPRSVLYLALEDSKRRMSSRLSAVHTGAEPGATWPSLLAIAHRWPRLNEGGVEDLATWVRYERSVGEDPGLIIIDTYQLVRPATRGRNVYAEDYEDLVPLQELATDEQVGIVLIHHNRKDVDGTDWIDALSGSTGITGAIDTVSALFRERGRHDATLKVTGRDLEDEPELALGFDKGVWVILGSAAEYRMSVEAADVVAYLLVNGVATPKQVAEALGRNDGSTRKLMWEMSKRGEIKAVGSGRYEPADSESP